MQLAIKYCLLLLAVSIIFQLLALISTPLSSITLYTSPGYKYGVFGYCNIRANKCSSRKIGYSFELAPAPIPPNKEPILPSGLKYSVTELLVVHPLSFAITITLYALICLMGLRKLGNSPKFLLSVALFSLPTFLVCLLTFLADILIFSPSVHWPGWLMLPATIIITICCSLLWNLRRTVSIKKYEALRSSRTNAIQAYSINNWEERSRSPPSILADSDDSNGKPLIKKPEFVYAGTITE